MNLLPRKDGFTFSLGCPLGSNTSFTGTTDYGRNTKLSTNAQISYDLGNNTSISHSQGYNQLFGYSTGIGFNHDNENSSISALVMHNKKLGPNANVQINRALDGNTTFTQSCGYNKGTGYNTGVGIQHNFDGNTSVSGSVTYGEKTGAGLGIELSKKF